MTIHKTVLLEETIEMLDLKEDDVVVDATLGGGGHSRKVLEKIGKKGTLIAFDRDLDALKRFEKSFEVSSKEFPSNIILVHDDYSALKDRLTSNAFFKADAILADLGISSDQLDDAHRGISFQIDAPLDMRMDLSKGITAADILNTYSEEEIKDILKKFGDEQFAGSIARAIIKKRESKLFERTLELVEVIDKAVPGSYKHKKIHPATKTFQALRIEVNKELEILESFLAQAVEILRPGGRLAIITFHSGEDAMVKNAFRENARGCICPPEFPICRCGKKPLVKLITTKPIVPSASEILQNPRARSAKLRVIEKI